MYSYLTSKILVHKKTQPVFFIPFETYLFESKIQNIANVSVLYLFLFTANVLFNHIESCENVEVQPQFLDPPD